MGQKTQKTQNQNVFTSVYSKLLVNFQNEREEIERK